MLPLVFVTVGVTRDFILFLRSNAERKLRIKDMKVEPLETAPDVEKAPYPFGFEIRWPWYRRLQVSFIQIFPPQS